ncbi:CATRA conflict system CASPASE/TPR repeat-associated protein [Rhodococcus aetherivorans]
MAAGAVVLTAGSGRRGGRSSSTGTVANCGPCPTRDPGVREPNRADPSRVRGPIVTSAIRAPALSVFVFAPADAGAGGPGDSLAHTWAAASTLGLTERASGIAAPVELPAEWPHEDLWFRVVAAKSDIDGCCTAVAFMAHDVAAVIFCLRSAVNSDKKDAWISLSGAWREAVGEDIPGVVFGSVQIFTGVVDQPPHPLRGAGDLACEAEDLAREVLGVDPHSGLELSSLIEPGIAFWNMEMPWGRAVVMLAEPDAATTMNEWCWVTPNDDDIGQLVRYFMHASKLRFEFGVFQNDIAALREKQRQLDDGLEELFELHQRLEESSALASELINAQSRLVRDQSGATGLLISITHLRDLRQTVEIAAHNLRAYEPKPLADGPASMSPFAHDLAFAEWLKGRIGHEISYLESCRERVVEAQELTDLRLRQLAAAHSRTANWLTVLQTSVLGALLAVFGVASALNPPFSVSTSVRNALLALVAAFALMLPPLAVRWTNGYGWQELIAVAILGATVGWMAAVTVSHAASLWVVLAAATLGAVLLAGIASLVNGRQSRH